MTKHLQSIHGQVKLTIQQNNAKYKAGVDRHRQHVLFEVGDFVWAVLTRDCFPAGGYNKLKERKIGPCEILQKINDNAYRLHLPSHMNTSDVFNVKHLRPFLGEPVEADTNSRARSFQPRVTDAGALESEPESGD